MRQAANQLPSVLTQAQASLALCPTSVSPRDLCADCCQILIANQWLERGPHECFPQLRLKDCGVEPARCLALCQSRGVQ